MAVTNEQGWLGRIYGRLRKASWRLRMESRDSFDGTALHAAYVEGVRDALSSVAAEWDNEVRRIETEIGTQHLMLALEDLEMQIQNERNEE